MLESRAFCALFLFALSWKAEVLLAASQGKGILVVVDVTVVRFSLELAYMNRDMSVCPFLQVWFGSISCSDAILSAYC